MPALIPAKAEEGTGEDEEADFGGPEDGAKVEPSGPVRTVTDYGDLLDDDGPAPRAKEEIDPTRPIGRRRPEAIHVRGVARLTRTHLAELLEVKKLPLFKWVEWITDDEAICVWEDPKDANVALQGCQAGFEATADVDSPGPGLWRAQRFMMDFRPATEADQPSVDFKKKHRGGRQVREFRFWEAMKDMSHNILDDQEEMMKHAPAPSGEDAFAAADIDDDAARRKRLRQGAHPEEEEEEEIDLLKMMAEADKQILAKQETNDEGVPVCKVNDTSLVKHEGNDEPESGSRGEKRAAESSSWGGSWNQHDDRWGNDGGGGRWGNGGGRGRGRWNNDDRGGDDDEGVSAKRRRQSTWSGGDGGGGGGGGRGRDGGDDRGEKRKDVDFQFSVDEQEQERRTKRAARFRTK